MCFEKNNFGTKTRPSNCPVNLTGPVVTGPFEKRPPKLDLTGKIPCKSVRAVGLIALFSCHS